MAKFFGFILGIAVALAGPAAFGVLASGGDVDLSARETAVVYAVWALALWIAVSLGAGAGALGATIVFAAMTYAVFFIPNRMTNFLNDIPGVTDGMIEGVKKAVLDGLVVVLGVITLVYTFQLIAFAARRRRLQRAEEIREVEQQEEARLAARREERERAAVGAPAGDDPYGDQPDQTRVFSPPDSTTTEFRPPADRGV
jgi:signal transduction histidine kinase